jgi:hypothetical protein
MNHTVGKGVPGPIALKMVAAYKEAVSGRSARYEKWLTYVNG